MGDKSVQKKQYIIDVAAKVFAEKGYKNVTMKDVVDACDLSLEIPQYGTKHSLNVSVSVGVVLWEMVR